MKLSYAQGAPAGELKANARRLKALLGCEHPR